MKNKLLLYGNMDESWKHCVGERSQNTIKIGKTVLWCYDQDTIFSCDWVVPEGGLWVLVIVSFFSWMLFTEVWSVCENVCTSLYVCFYTNTLPPTHTPKQNSFHFPHKQQKDFQTYGHIQCPLWYDDPGHLLPTLWHMCHPLRITHSAGTS